jgi:hypothetical protein
MSLCCLDQKDAALSNQPAQDSTSLAHDLIQWPTTQLPPHEGALAGVIEERASQ